MTIQRLTKHVNCWIYFVFTSVGCASVIPLRSSRCLRARLNLLCFWLGRIGYVTMESAFCVYDGMRCASHISLSLCVYKYIKLRARCCCCIPFEHIRLLYIHSDTRTNERREWAHTRVACGMLYCWIGDQQQFAFADDRCFFFFYLVVLRRRFGRWTYNIHMRNACIGG